MSKGSKKVYAFYLRVATKHIYLHYIETNKIARKMVMFSKENLPIKWTTVAVFIFTNI